MLCAIGIGQLLNPVIPVSTVPPLVHHGNLAPINLIPLSEVRRHLLVFFFHDYISDAESLVVSAAGLITMKVVSCLLCASIFFIIDNVNQFNSQ